MTVQWEQIWSDNAHWICKVPTKFYCTLYSCALLKFCWKLLTFKTSSVYIFSQFSWWLKIKLLLLLNSHSSPRIGTRPFLTRERHYFLLSVMHLHISRPNQRRYYSKSSSHLNLECSLILASLAFHTRLSTDNGFTWPIYLGHPYLNGFSV